MVDTPSIDTSKLGSGLLDLAKRFLRGTVDTALGTISGLADGAKSLGINAFSGVSDTISGLVHKFMDMIGLSAPAAAEAPAPVATTPAPATTPAVTPPATPRTQQPQRQR